MAHLFDQPSTNETIKWKADSDLRGSFSIVSTCTITLILGVWSAVHLNLPGNPHSQTEAFLRRTAWIVCSLFAPEVLIFVAWTQRLAAKRIQKKVETMFIEKSKPSNDREAQMLILNNKWTMTHSFWAIMGGIAIDVNGSEPFIPSTNPPKLTEEGIYLLLKLEPDLLPDITEDEIKDKSKGDWLTKSLAMIQATWFCVSCFVRLGQKLPMSLLELNTFAHAMCTIIVYFIWWKKPLDVERPLLIRSDRIRPLLAYMWMASKTSARPKIKRNGSTSYKVGRHPELEAITLGDRKVPMDTSSQTTDSTSSTTIKVTPSNGLAGTRFFVNPSSTRWTVERITNTGSSDYDSRTYTVTFKEPAEFNLTVDDVRRWRLSQEALEKYRLPKPTNNHNLVTVKPVPELLQRGQSKRPWARLGFSMLAACYGMLHALGWNTRFPTRRERILWRVSAILIASPAGGWLAIVLVNMFIRSLGALRDRFRRKLDSSENKNDLLSATIISQSSEAVGTPQPQAGNSLKEPRLLNTEMPEAHGGKAWKRVIDILIILIKVVLTNACIFLYIPARAYIVAESFRMAFFLPPDVFRATQWEKYFPHIG
ncbi:hypothetical protein BKA66DRAFT_90039 [Pyrenochaeta sp. MPI-SDFR-AT-0127]|nr:hypothetical protein BKA66DRAFT_90039 [Pyrenochaeta sp. MPI-SDFR-AT-0127]